MYWQIFERFLPKKTTMDRFDAARSIFFKLWRVGMYSANVCEINNKKSNNIHSLIFRNALKETGSLALMFGDFRMEILQLFEFGK